MPQTVRDENADCVRPWRAVAVDMRGHGDSAWDPKGAYLVEDYVSDIVGVAEQLKLANIARWGNATGGRVAQVFAGIHPELVSYWGLLTGFRPTPRLDAGSQPGY